MAHLIELPTHSDSRGSLTVLEKILPFEIKRLFWIYDLTATSVRGQHRHLSTWQGMICLHGKCEVFIQKNSAQKSFLLQQPNQVLILEPEDWHEMKNFSELAILLVAASQGYEPSDYVKEPLA